ncbi:MAG: hypothetical protein GKR94_19805 [Gammaproteobacteria bacterium]|nr:hypothetical protein [Gammaproteobacteria bacterium]
MTDFINHKISECGLLEVPNSQLHGQGTFTEPNGDVYTGAFVNSLRHGEAK